MRVAGGQLYAGEASPLLEFLQQLSATFIRFSKGNLESNDLSVAVSTDSDDNGCADRTASSRRIFSCIASANRNGYSSSRGRSVQAGTCVSSLSVRLLTVCRLSSLPQSSVVIFLIRRVETP